MCRGILCDGALGFRRVSLSSYEFVDFDSALVDSNDGEEEGASCSALRQAALNL